MADANTPTQQDRHFAAHCSCTAPGNLVQDFSHAIQKEVDEDGVNHRRVPVRLRRIQLR
jgi:hypothetical protein